MKWTWLLYGMMLCLNVQGQNFPFSEKYSVACHNCFESQYVSSIEDAFNYTSTIELDIWDSKILSGGNDAMIKDWYVKHSPLELGNKNCCGGSFWYCLSRINAWATAHPDHELITIFIDKKENWSEPGETREPLDLDELLISIFTK